MPGGIFYLNSLDRPICYIRGVWCSAASDLGLHCLLMSLLRDDSLNGLSEDTKEMLQSQSTAIPRHQKKAT